MSDLPENLRERWLSPALGFNLSIDLTAAERLCSLENLFQVRGSEVDVLRIQFGFIAVFALAPKQARITPSQSK